MKTRQYDVVILPDGRVTLQIEGHAGKGCLEVARWFEQIVGSLESTRETSEFYEPDERVCRRLDQQC